MFIYLFFFFSFLFFPITVRTDDGDFLSIDGFILLMIHLIRMSRVALSMFSFSFLFLFLVIAIFRLLFFFSFSSAEGDLLD